MIELEDTESEFEVEVCAVIGVHRKVRVKARDRVRVLKMPPTVVAPPAEPAAAVENKA